MITDSRGLSNVFEWRCGMSVGMFREITANVKLYLEIQFSLTFVPPFFIYTEITSFKSSSSITIIFDSF